MPRSDDFSFGIFLVERPQRNCWILPRWYHCYHPIGRWYPDRCAHQVEHCAWDIHRRVLVGHEVALEAQYFVMKTGFLFAGHVHVPHKAVEDSNFRRAGGTLSEAHERHRLTVTQDDCLVTECGRRGYPPSFETISLEVVDQPSRCWAIGVIAKQFSIIARTTWCCRCYWWSSWW